MLMKRNKWILYIDGVLLSVFAACSADSPMEMVQDDGRVEIHINSNIASSVEAATRAVPVSYTHLTLPTILLV